MYLDFLFRNVGIVLSHFVAHEEGRKGRGEGEMYEAYSLLWQGRVRAVGT